jgi:uncharacterized protein C1orf43 homolog
MRFTLKSKREPHYPIACDAHNCLKKEIEMRFELVKDIKYEPKLVYDNCTMDNSFPLHHSSKEEVGQCISSEYFFIVINCFCLIFFYLFIIVVPVSQHFYRMKAMDDLSLLEEAIMQASNDKNVKKRRPGQDLRYYLFKMSKDDNPLAGCDSKLIAQFVDLYLNARHEPSPVFDLTQYHKYQFFLRNLCDYIEEKTKRSKSCQDSFPQPCKDTQVGLNGETTLRAHSSNTSYPHLSITNTSETCL